MTSAKAGLHCDLYTVCFKKLFSCSFYFKLTTETRKNNIVRKCIKNCFSRFYFGKNKLFLIICNYPERQYYPPVYTTVTRNFANNQYISTTVSIKTNVQLKCMKLSQCRLEKKESSMWMNNCFHTYDNFMLITCKNSPQLFPICVQQIIVL